jgi:hypothetical protein
LDPFVKSGKEVAYLSLSSPSGEIITVLQYGRELFGITVKQSGVIGIQRPTRQHFRAEEPNQFCGNSFDEVIREKPTALCPGDLYGALLYGLFIVMGTPNDNFHYCSLHASPLGID